MEQLKDVSAATYEFEHVEDVSVRWVNSKRIMPIAVDSAALYSSL